MSHVPCHELLFFYCIFTLFVWNSWCPMTSNDVAFLENCALRLEYRWYLANRHPLPAFIYHPWLQASLYFPAYWQSFFIRSVCGWPGSQTAESALLSEKSQGQFLSHIQFFCLREHCWSCRANCNPQTAPHSSQYSYFDVFILKQIALFCIISDFIG